MRLQAAEPRQLVVELRTRLGIAVRQIDAPYKQSLDCRFDISRLVVGRIARRGGSRDNGFSIACENGNTVPGLLPAPNRMIAGLRDRPRREFRVRAFQLLQAGDIGPCRFQPVEKVGQPPIDIVDVESRDLHLTGRNVSPETNMRTPLRSFMGVPAVRLSKTPYKSAIENEGSGGNHQPPPRLVDNGEINGN